MNSCKTDKKMLLFIFEIVYAKEHRNEHQNDSYFFRGIAGAAFLL